MIVGLFQTRGTAAKKAIPLIVDSLTVGIINWSLPAEQSAGGH